MIFTELDHTLSTTYILLILGASAFSYHFYRKYAANPRRLPLPPGPKPWPLIGNALQIPSTLQWLTYAKWAETYGAQMSSPFINYQR